MNIKRQFKIVMIISLASLMAIASPNLEENAPPSLADHIHLSRSKDHVDGGWLANLTGLPNKSQVELLTKHVKKIMLEETDNRCNAINPRLRLMVFQHFAMYQHIANAQNIYFDKNIAHTWAHFLAMILKESSGDSTSVTDMSGHSVSTYESQTDLQNWKNILSSTVQKKIEWNYQTNFGLTQTSADRLYVAFHVAQNQGYDTEFLEGKEGASTPRKIPLNTAIAIRRLIWFYQDFAEGRISQSQGRIHQQNINKPEFSNQYHEGLKMALLYCGTRFMFHEKNQSGAENEPAFENAMASIAFCKLGNSQTGYGRNEFDERCFAEWVTLCPALNIDIAILTPLSYFATRGEKPVCEDTFKRLIIPKSKLLRVGLTLNNLYTSIVQAIWMKLKQGIFLPLKVFDTK